LGAGGTVHLLILIPLITLLVVHRNFRKWKYLGTMAAFLVFYLYVPLTNRPPYMWDPPTSNVLQWVKSFATDNIATAYMLIGGLAIWELPKRILDTLGLIGLSFTLAVIPILAALWRPRVWKEPLFWLFAVPIILFCTNMAPQTAVYLMPAIAFGAILAGVGLVRMTSLWTKIRLAGTRKGLVYSLMPVLVLVSSVGMLGYNTNLLDIGRTLDSQMSAMKFYNEELPKVPDGDILVAQQGWEWAIVFLYNRNEGKNIIPIYTGTLPSTIYQQQLKEQGVKLIDDPEESISTRPISIGESIFELNDNVWSTLVTVPSTYGSEVIPVKHGGQLAVRATYNDGYYYDGQALLFQGSGSVPDMSKGVQWQFKPSNPYGFITGSIEVEQWTWVTFSNYSILTFVMMAAAGVVPCWILYMLFIKKKKWKLRKPKNEVEVVVKK
jgi:hypothetical protein